MRRYTTPRILVKIEGIREGMNMSVYLDSTTLLAGDGSYVQHRCYEHGGALWVTS